MALLLISSAVAQQWKPAPVTLMTPDNAWREYPRPQLVRPRWQNLNGLWDYAITPKTAAAPAKYEGQLLVPYAPEAALSGVGKILQPNEQLWYHRSFTVPAAWKGERILLHFGAAAVYTQTTDVEGEVNGLLTYDRRFVKIDPATLREMNAPLTGGK